MRVRFIGEAGRRLEIIKTSENTHQVIFVNGEDRGISDPTWLPLGDIVERITNLGWKMLPQDQLEARATRETELLNTWRDSFNPKFKPEPFRPKIYESRPPKKIRCVIFDVTNLPTP